MRRLTTVVLALALLGITPALAADNNHRDNNNSGFHQQQTRQDNNFRKHRWNRGEKINRSWFLYTPVDWRRHHFNAPRHGYHWIYVDGFYLLIDRNGFIIQVVGG